MKGFKEFYEDVGELQAVINSIKKCAIIPKEPTFRGISGPKAAYPMFVEKPRTMANGVGRKPRDSKPMFNNFFNIMMEVGGRF